MSIISQAKDELRRINFGKADSQAMIEILERFFEQWESGGAVWAAAPVLQRLIAGKPLSPLSGDDDEWREVGEGVFQNLRCSTVFKQDGKIYDIDVEGRPQITFPYNPEKAVVSSPLVEIGD